MDIYKEYRTLIDDLQKTCWGEGTTAVDAERRKAANALMDLLEWVNRKQEWTDADRSDAIVVRNQLIDRLMKTAIVHKLPDGVHVYLDVARDDFLYVEGSDPTSDDIVGEWFPSLPVHGQARLQDILDSIKEAKGNDK